MTRWAPWRLALYFCLLSGVSQISQAIDIPLSILQVAPPCAENCLIYFITESWGNVSCGVLSPLECWCTVSGNLLIPLGSGAEQCTSFCDPDPAAEKQASNICNGVSLPVSLSSTSSSASSTTTTSSITTSTSTIASSTTSQVSTTSSTSTTLLTASSTTSLGSATSSVAATAAPIGGNGSKSLSTGALVGIVLGVLALGVAAAILVVLVFRTRQRKRQASNTPEFGGADKKLESSKSTPEIYNPMQFAPENVRNEPSYNRTDFSNPALSYTRSPPRVDPPRPAPPSEAQRLGPQAPIGRAVNQHLRRPEQLQRPGLPHDLRLAAIPVLTPLQIPGAGPTPRGPQKQSPKHDKTPLLSSPILKEDMAAQLAQSISLAASPSSTTPSTTLPFSHQALHNTSKSHIAMMSKQSTISASPASTASRDHPALRQFRTPEIMPVEAPERSSAQDPESAWSSAAPSQEEFPIAFHPPPLRYIKPIWQMTPPSAISPQNDPHSAFYDPSPMSPNEPWNNLQNGGYFSTTPQAPVMFPDNNHAAHLGKKTLTPINEETREYMQVRQRAEKEAESPAGSSSSPRDYLQVRQMAEQQALNERNAGSSQTQQMKHELSGDSERQARDGILSSVQYPRIPSLKHRSGQLKRDDTFKLSLPAAYRDQATREDNGSPRLPKRSPARLQKPSVEEYSPPHLTSGSSVQSWQSGSEAAPQPKPEATPEPSGFREPGTFRAPRKTDTWRTSMSSQYSRATTQPQGLRKPSPKLGSPFQPVERSRNQDSGAYGR